MMNVLQKKQKYYFAKKWGCHGTPGTPVVDGPDNNNLPLIKTFTVNRITYR